MAKCPMKIISCVCEIIIDCEAREIMSLVASVLLSVHPSVSVITMYVKIIYNFNFSFWECTCIARQHTINQLLLPTSFFCTIGKKNFGSDPESSGWPIISMEVNGATFHVWNSYLSHRWRDFLSISCIWMDFYSLVIRSPLPSWLTMKNCCHENHKFQSGEPPRPPTCLTK